MFQVPVAIASKIISSHYWPKIAAENLEVVKSVEENFQNPKNFSTSAQTDSRRPSKCTRNGSWLRNPRDTSNGSEQRGRADNFSYL